MLRSRIGVNSPTFVTVVNLTKDPILIDIKNQFHPILDAGLVVISDSGSLSAG